MNNLLWLSKRVLFFAAAMGSGSSFAEVITITTGPDPYLARSQSATYTGSCVNGEYELYISHGEKRIQIKLQGSRLPVDLSVSKFGKVYLTHLLTGNLSFSCHKNSVGVNYRGFELELGKPARPIQLDLYINHGGMIEEDKGLEDESLEDMTRTLPYVLKLR